MLRCSFVTTNVLGLCIDVVEIDPDTNAQAGDRKTEVAAKVTH
jgi:hypothetical protein